LNNEPLSLIDGKEMPNIQPAISSTEKGIKLKLPSGGIGFWILPGLKVRLFQFKKFIIKLSI
jgi:hypothetical protein